MFGAIQKVIRNLKAESEPVFDATDPRVATAALAVHAIAVDGIVDEPEKVKLRLLMQQKFDLNDDETSRLIAEARRRDLEAIDLYAFTSVLKRALDEDGRRGVVEMLWELVYADGEVHEVEDNFIWRVAELLGISSRERIALRKRVEHAPDHMPKND
ncbi:TerB family tellurite resistance protein [Microbaculum marinisediminis]|uniref:TerB family tellurite resistance protein n=1 Tax=Microbaculum marinisediminis TaxID=2931392 RepID=A0AAW5QWN3_9HYPH|nr:TerB family tellurite resistance protein [Microbaculum sp. A6E488]MCT8972332.1 TerB family tellurite resistance protein [Microbaculum sp. A6E488]